MGLRSIGLPEVLVLFGILFLLGLALFLLVGALRWKQSRSVQRALIEKLSANELMGLLQTPQGERLMRGLAEASAAPGHSILTSVQRGIVVILTGIGMLVAGGIAHSPEVLPAIATVLIFIGIGLLVAGFAAYGLSKRWRLFGDNDGASSNLRTG